MALVLCKACKKAFLNSPEEEEICPACVVRLRELYPSVRGFLRNNEKKPYTIPDLSKDMGIALNDLESMVSIGLLEYQAASAVPSASPQQTKGKWRSRIK